MLYLSCLFSCSAEIEPTMVLRQQQVSAGIVICIDQNVFLIKGQGANVMLAEISIFYYMDIR